MEQERIEMSNFVQYDRNGYTGLGGGGLLGINGFELFIAIFSVSAMIVNRKRK